MAESVKLKDDRYIDPEGIYDFEQKKTQKQINGDIFNKILGDFQFVFPSDCKSLAMEWGVVNEALTIKANAYSAAVVNFKNAYTTNPLVIPIWYVETGPWPISTAVISSVTNKQCAVSVKNFEAKDYTVVVGYIAIGQV